MRSEFVRRDCIRASFDSAPLPARVHTIDSSSQSDRRGGAAEVKAPIDVVKERPSLGRRLPRAMDTKPHEALNMANKFLTFVGLLVVSVPAAVISQTPAPSTTPTPTTAPKSAPTTSPNGDTGDGAANHATPTATAPTRTAEATPPPASRFPSPLACSSIRRRTRPPRSSPMTNTTGYNWSKTQSGYDPWCLGAGPVAQQSSASSRQRRQRANR